MFHCTFTPVYHLCCHTLEDLEHFILFPAFFNINLKFQSMIFNFKFHFIQIKDSKDAAPSPRTTGSLVAHHDDLITRMKNIEMIELGGHRIRPWYFSPYPQVGVFLSI